MEKIIEYASFNHLFHEHEEIETLYLPMDAVIRSIESTGVWFEYPISLADTKEKYTLLFVDPFKKIELTEKMVFIGYIRTGNFNMQFIYKINEEQ